MIKKRMIDLFAGTGAFSYVLTKHPNIECVFSNDMCKNSEKIYNLNHDNNLTLGDLNDIETENIPEHDILCGGFPCQPFSIAGKQEGFKDKRANVFWKILEIIEYHKPEVVILENVKNLQSHDDGNTFKTIKENIEKLGYSIKFKVLNTCEISEVPQNRERIYIVCFRNSEHYNKFSLDFITVDNRPIVNFLEKEISKKYYYTDKLSVYDTVTKDVTKNVSENVLYQYRRYYIRENKSGVCPTLTANMGGGGHNVPLLLDNEGIRKLTPRECFNLQGFPNDFDLGSGGISDSGLYKLAGNAVSIPVISLICKRITDILFPVKKKLCIKKTVNS